MSDTKSAARMETKVAKDGSKATIAVAGRVDTTTAPDFDAVIQETLPGVADLVIDMADLAYISSAGLRVLLGAQKAMNKQGQMVLRNVNDTVQEIFDVTGFSDILHIENA